MQEVLFIKHAMCLLNPVSLVFELEDPLYIIKVAKYSLSLNYVQSSKLLFPILMLFYSSLFS